MSNIIGVNNTLKEVLYENLLAILSDDKGVRSNAEQQLKLLETNEGLCHSYCLLFSHSYCL
jgi:hypothetical protein